MVCSMLSNKVVKAVGTAAAAAATLLVVRRVMQRVRERNLPPRNETLSPLGDTLEYYKDHAQFVRKSFAKFKGTFRVVTVLESTVYLYPTAENLKLITGQKSLGWPKHYPTVVGESSVSMVTGAAHKKGRVVSGRAFTPKALDNFLPKTQEAAREHLKRWVLWSSPEDTRPALKLFTFQLAHEVILGRQLPEELSKKMMDLFDESIKGLVCPYPYDVPGFMFRKCMNARRELDKIYQGVIDEQRKATPEVPVTMLEHVMTPDTKDGDIATNTELIDFCYNMVFAGHDTTLASMQSLLYLLSTNPTVMQELRDEVDALWDGEAVLTRDSLRLFHKSRAFVSETLRMVPPIASTVRRLDSATDVDGYHLPRGTKVAVDSISVNDLVYGPDAPVKLARFLNEDGTFKETTFDFQLSPAFGTGSRMCLGYKFALDQILIFLVTLVRLYDFNVISSVRQCMPIQYHRVTSSFSVRCQ